MIAQRESVLAAGVDEPAELHQVLNKLLLVQSFGADDDDRGEGTTHGEDGGGGGDDVDRDGNGDVRNVGVRDGGDAEDVRGAFAGDAQHVHTLSKLDDLLLHARDLMRHHPPEMLFDDARLRPSVGSACDLFPWPWWSSDDVADAKARANAEAGAGRSTGSRSERGHGMGSGSEKKASEEQEDEEDQGGGGESSSGRGFLLPARSGGLGLSLSMRGLARLRGILSRAAETNEDAGESNQQTVEEQLQPDALSMVNVAKQGRAVMVLATNHVEPPEKQEQERERDWEKRKLSEGEVEARAEKEKEKHRERRVMERLSRSPLPVDVARGPPLAPSERSAAQGKHTGPNGRGDDSRGVLHKSKSEKEIRYSGEGPWGRHHQGEKANDTSNERVAYARTGATITAMLAAVLIATDFLSAVEVEQILVLKCLRYGVWGLDLLTDPIFPQVGRAILKAVARAIGIESYS